jgi:uroporphyrinogen III methyltransferase/synthase
LINPDISVNIYQSNYIMKQLNNKHNIGTVYLIGAGPGDPGLLTRAGADALKRADVVVFDKLANPALLKLAPQTAELIDVGKSPSLHKYTQNEINSILVKLAIQGKTVCRLKGGDPFVFGRGSEEATALRDCNIPFVIIPGVSSAIAVPAYAGIPVTDRRYARSFAVVTGHDSANNKDSEVKYETPNADTIIYLMGLTNLPIIIEQLIANGRNSATPVAVIQEGTTLHQRVVTGTLATIVEQVAAVGLHSPVVIVVGDVVRLHESIDWFARQPLFGKRILVTRAQHQADSLAMLLTETGAEPVIFPLITMKLLPVPDNLVSRLQKADWIVFTSANGITSLVQNLQKIGCDLRAMGMAKIAAVGQGTAQSLTNFNLNVDFIPHDSDAASLANELPDLLQKHIVIISPLKQNNAFHSILQERGAKVDIIPVYETVPTHHLELPDLATIDIVTFTSPSTVHAFCNLATGNIGKIVIACMGLSTAIAAREAGLNVDIQVSDNTMPAFVEALEQYYLRNLAI